MSRLMPCEHWARAFRRLSRGRHPCQPFLVSKSRKPSGLSRRWQRARIGDSHLEFDPQQLRRNCEAGDESSAAAKKPSLRNTWLGFAAKLCRAQPSCSIYAFVVDEDLSEGFLQPIARKTILSRRMLHRHPHRVRRRGRISANDRTSGHLGKGNDANFRVFTWSPGSCPGV